MPWADSDPEHSSGSQVVHFVCCLFLVIVCWNISGRKGWNKDVLLGVLALSWLQSSEIQLSVKVSRDRYVSFPFPFSFLDLSALFLCFICRSVLVSLSPSCCLTFLSLHPHSPFLSDSCFPREWHARPPSAKPLASFFLYWNDFRRELKVNSVSM